MSLPIDLDLLRRPTRGRMYDLCAGWWPGMPLAEGHPPFQVLTFRSPAGERNAGDISFLQDNPNNFGWISELLMATLHTGTHIDALCHTTYGPDSTWHGGHSADTELGDFGPFSKDARELPPMFCRGVSLDLPAVLGVEQMAAGTGAGVRELEAACERQGVDVRAGDVVLIRTGTMRDWPDPARMPDGAGLNLEGAIWLAERGVVAVGGDTSVLEQQPSVRPGDPQPVHRELIHARGIPILEWVNQEELAADGVSEFLFVCLPLPIKGATASLIRPMAIA